jgi:hypothetical protein
MMNANDWESANESHSMLDALRNPAHNRKHQLLTVAWCRYIPGLIEKAIRRTVVDTVEMIADGLVKEEERQAVLKRFQATIRYRSAPNMFGIAGPPLDMAALYAIQTDFGPAYCAGNCLLEIQSMVTLRHERVTESRDFDGIESSSWQDERPKYCDFIRDIFGNPFRPVTTDPAWLTWNDGTARKLAQTIYDERRFELLPILADALEESGCDNADILTHCRGPGPHVHGCWVVDLLLGKE